ncbi:hypothetical protein GWI33_008644 [Rhynchophorus ferrugineus]|uniref:Uncharacterized protein n=1 Tax=Rhynchophorus ferrugineus TaxID=354439 RepID=A0A834MH90_RHYFE|nr:hypothetical protein GWI33_008644 [Rhynchophorus ferrugineus]
MAPTKWRRRSAGSGRGRRNGSLSETMVVNNLKKYGTIIVNTGDIFKDTADTDIEDPFWSMWHWDGKKDVWVTKIQNGIIPHNRANDKAISSRSGYNCTALVVNLAKNVLKYLSTKGIPYCSTLMDCNP